MHIQVVQDLVCPWCRIGKHNLDEAITQYTEQHDAEVTVEWVPFLLDPVEAGSKEPFRERLAERKGMSEEQIEGMFTRASEAGEACGLDFNFDKVSVAVDTIPAHQLIALAPTEKQASLLDALHTAYFENGKDIGEPAVLEAVAREVGLDDETIGFARETWGSADARRAILDVIGQVQRAGISGVPFFIFNSSLAASGAQPPATLVEAMNQAREMAPVGAQAD